MTEQSTVFGIYGTAQQAEKAVDRLVHAGFSEQSISVLHPENASSREFADRKNTRVPKGVAEGETAGLPLDGTAGIWDPGSGPKLGALSAALADMGVPADWCDRRVVHGKLLLAVECETSDQTASAIEILQSTGAEQSATAGRAQIKPSTSREKDSGPDIGTRNVS